MKSAYLIDTSEAVQCISDVLIGLQMGFLSGMDAQKLYALEEHIRPAMLTGAPQDRDKKRAEILREATKPQLITCPAGAHSVRPLQPRC